MFGEPPRSEYDFHFNVFGVPARVHPFFWLLSAFLGMNAPGGNRGVLIFMVVALVSILVHELGHALVIRSFGWSPRIVLHGFGGLAIYDPSHAFGRRGRKSGNEQILISLAGPIAGFALALLTIVMLYLTKHFIQFPIPFVSTLPVLGPRTGTELAWFQETASPAAFLVFDLLEINIYWGLLNLLPIFPLDGGQVSRELFLANTGDAIRKSLTLSFVTSAGVAFCCMVLWGQPWMALMFGYMAYSNYQQLSPQSGGGFGQNRPW